jgi:L-iditol 2-dehydrogenase
METMRAARLHEVGKIVCEEAPVRPPGDGDLLVRTELASICGSDLHTIFLPFSVGGYPAHPGYPGHEGVGEVAVSNHAGFAPGDKVLTVPHAWLGACFADYQTVPGDSCIKLPEADAPIGHMLMAQQLGTVVFALRHRPVDVTGATVVVLGQGSAGLFFTWLLRHAGAATIVTADLSDARLACSRAMGADLAVKADGGAVRAAVMDATNGRGAELVVDAVGSSATLRQTADLAAYDGTLLWFGLPDRADPEPLDFVQFFRKRLRASSTYGAQAEPGLVSFHRALDLIVRGEIDVSPLLSHVLPIERVDEACLIAHERGQDALKVSLSF